MSIAVVVSLLEKTKDFSIEETLSFLANEYPNQVVFSTSFGQEDQVLTDYIFKNNIDVGQYTINIIYTYNFVSTIFSYLLTIVSYIVYTPSISTILDT